MRVAATILGLRVLALCAVASSPLVAQVGHPPGASPFRDIRKGHTLTVLGGYFGGSGGDLNMGPHNGRVIGGRYDIRTGGTIQLGLGVSHGSLERFIVNPYVRLANRISGPVPQSVTFADLTVQFNMTGGKSWNRLAPFIASGVGLAFAEDTPADTSGYDFGNEFYLAPSAGVRVFLSDRFHFKGEVKAIFWKLDYPTTFQQEPVEEPGTIDDRNAVITDNDLSEWTSSPWVQLGFGYSFSP